MSHVIHVNFRARRGPSDSVPNTNAPLRPVQAKGIVSHEPVRADACADIPQLLRMRASLLRKQLAELDAVRDSTKSEYDQVMRAIGETC